MKLHLLDSWNTGSLYSEHGQRIALFLIVDDGYEYKGAGHHMPESYAALFIKDYDRGIEHVIEKPRTPSPRSTSELADYAMHSYLWNENITGRYAIYFDPPEAPVSFPLRRRWPWS